MVPGHEGSGRVARSRSGSLDGTRPARRRRKSTSRRLPHPACLPRPTETAKPAGEIDPIVALVRQRLAAAPPGGNAGDRDDRAGLAAFYAEHNGEPVWTGKDGFTARATQAIGEIRKADDWGLKASAFDLPALPQGPATAEALAEAEIKLGLAVLKYGRHARGGRVEPLSVHRIFDQKPTIYDPKTLMLAVAASSAVDAYLRDLHPRHPQFERLRQALLAARAAKPEDAVPATAKPGENIQRLIVNMERWRWMPPNLGAFYVWDSVPEQMTIVFKDGKPVLSEKIVVGKPSSPTPVFTRRHAARHLSSLMGRAAGHEGVRARAAIEDSRRRRMVLLQLGRLGRAQGPRTCS